MLKSGNEPHEHFGHLCVASSASMLCLARFLLNFALIEKCEGGRIFTPYLARSLTRNIQPLTFVNACYAKRDDESAPAKCSCAQTYSFKLPNHCMITRKLLDSQTSQGRIIVHDNLIDVDTGRALT